MEVQLTSDPAALDCLANDLAQPGGGEGAVERDPGVWEDRERRRIEFRSSLMRARATWAEGNGCEMVQRSVQQFPSELRERRACSMMAELANAH